MVAEAAWGGAGRDDVDSVPDSTTDALAAACAARAGSCKDLSSTRTTTRQQGSGWHVALVSARVHVQGVERGGSGWRGFGHGHSFGDDGTWQRSIHVHRSQPAHVQLCCDAGSDLSARNTTSTAVKYARTRTPRDPRSPQNNEHTHLSRRGQHDRHDGTGTWLALHRPMLHDRGGTPATTTAAAAATLRLLVVLLSLPLIRCQRSTRLSKLLLARRQQHPS